MLHPLVESLSPSPEQQPAITVRGRDVVVTAGAGTGKTRTLVARYLALLSEDVPLRSIVAITFTQKAAREMRNRVRESLRLYLADANLSAAEHERWQQRYSELDAARISTIHSLCTDILRAHPAEAGLDPRFEVLDEGRTNLLQRQALDEALAHAADTEALVPLFSLLGERGLEETLATLLARRLEASVIFDALPDDLLAHWATQLAQRQQAALEALLAGEPWQSGVAVLRDNPATDPDDKREIQRQLALAAIDGATGELPERLDSLAGLGQLDLRGGKAGSWPGGKEQADAVKVALATLRDLWRGQAALLDLHLTPHDAQLAEAVPLLRDLFVWLTSRYETFKQADNALDFDDLEAEALWLLREHPAIAAEWQRDIQAILTDEFQDTNGRQRDLLMLLNGDEGKLFVVGDAKQSIYRFRGADVTIFRAERARIEQNGGQHVALDTSYRAHAPLLEGLNDLLRPILGERAAATHPWVEPFARLEPHRMQPGAGFDAPHIELHLTVGSKSDGALDRAAIALVYRCIELVETQAVQVGTGDRARRLTYGDIVILCRASTSFGAYEDALEQAGVPFLTVAGRGFYHRPEIRDVLNALQAVADPTDNLALAGLLRSPVFGLSDEDLFRLLEARRVAGAASLWDILWQLPDNLSAEARQRAERARDIIEQLREQAGRVPVADLLKALLDATGYRAALLRAGQQRAARNVAKLLADAHASGMVGVGEFLEYVQGLRDTGAREGEARATAEGVVQLMTVHAAKGLEFPVVVIGDASYSPPNRSGLLLDDQLGLLLPQKDDDGEVAASYLLGKQRADDLEQAESDRLLYVAATRAQEKLLVSAAISLGKDSTPGRLGQWLGQLAGESVLGLAGTAVTHDETGAGVIDLPLEVGQTPVACRIYEPNFGGAALAPSGAAPDEGAAVAPPPLLAALAATDRGGESVMERSERVWRVVPAVERPRAPHWVVGQVVHAALAAWRFPDEKFDGWAEAVARGTGLIDARQLADAVRESRRLLARFQGHPLYQRIAQAERRHHEVPYSLLRDGEAESGVIDLLLLEAGQWVIVEFKTDMVWDEAKLRTTLADTDYMAQVRRYMRAVELLLGQSPAALLCWLNYRPGVEITPVMAPSE